MKQGFFKRNQKKLLAIFSAGLMIAFALPSANSNSKNRDVVIGSIGKKEITNKDASEARAQWELLRTTFSVMQPERGVDGQTTEKPVPFLPLFFAGLLGNQQEGEAVAARLHANPELFYLLCREAEATGTVVSNDQIQDIMKNALLMDDNLGGYEERARDAVRSLLLVANASTRAANMVKVSRPFRDQNLATEQPISLNLVEFKAGDYLAAPPAWTEAEKAAKTKALYEQYKNYEPTTRPANDFSFGYKVPNQVRVQYIELPGEAIRKAVTDKITDVEVIKYFYKNIALYPAPLGNKPRPGVAATQPTALPALSKVFTQRPPTTAPSSNQSNYFAEYRDEVTKRLTDERIGNLTKDILVDLNAQMNKDYAEFKAAVSSGNPGPTTAATLPTDALAKAPQTSLGVTYDSYEYLRKLALQTQEKFGVLPITQQTPGLQTEAQLAAEPGISKATFEGTDLLSLYRQANNNFELAQQISQMISPWVNFPGYAAHFIAPLADDQVRNIGQLYRRLRILALFEPSPLLRGMPLEPNAIPSTFIFRAIAAMPAYPAPESEVQEKLLADARLAEAYQRAVKDATDFATAIPPRNPYLQAAAATAHKPLVTTGVFTRQNPSIENLKLPSGPATAIFANGAYLLLNNTSADRLHPLGLIELKPQASIFVAQINEIKPRWTSDTFPSAQLYTAMSLDRQLGSQLRQRWFAPDDIQARSHFVPTQSARDKGSKS